MEILLFDGHGGVEAADMPPATPGDGFVWLDFDRESEPDWAARVAELAGLAIHEAHVSDSLNPAHPSYFDDTQYYEMLVFRGLAAESGDARFATRPSAFFLAPGWLITVRDPDSRSVPAIKQRMLSRSGRAVRQPAGLMYLILNAMVERFLLLREPLSQELDGWQDQLLEPGQPMSDWRALMSLDGELRQLEMLCEGQEDAIEAWREATDIELGDVLSVRYNDLLEHIRRVLHHARHLHDQVQALAQLHFSAVAHHTNEVVRVLTVLAVVFLPLTLIAGVYGMNFEYMPELGLRYGYFFVLGAMVGVAGILLALFRYKRWI